MNIGIMKAKNSIMNQRKLYLFLIGLIIVGLISGILFLFAINDTDKSLVLDNLTSFFTGIKNGQGINYGASLINSLLTNIIYILLIWLLGISIIGLPIILIIVAIKTFIIGFSISSIVSIYGFKGVIGSICYIAPHQLLFIFLLLLLSFYSVSFCIKLFKYLFLKQSINFKLAMQRYLKVLIISIGIGILSSLLEVFVSTYLIKLFTLLI